MKSRIGLFILIGLFLYIVDYRFSYDEDLNQIIIPDDEIIGLIAVSYTHLTLPTTPYV